MADNQDPLAALQQLLEDQKKQTNSSASTPNAAAVSAPPVLENPPAEEEKKPGPTPEELAVLQQQKEAEDRAKIEEQLSKMQNELKNTPQYQARLSQKQSNEALSEQKRLEERSQRIFQLKHLDS